MLIQPFGFNATGQPTGRLLSPGMQFGGGSIGAVFGSYPNQYGVIVANIELGVSVPWGPDGFDYSANGNLFAGTANTAGILAGDPNAVAAKYCNDYSASMGGTTYTDWVYPSLEDLQYCKPNNSVLLVPFNISSGEGGPSQYWTSTAQATTSFNLSYFVDFNPLGLDGTGFRCCGSSSPGPGLNFRPVRYFDYR